MSRSLLVTSCPPVPGSPPQTTDEDSESSDMNKVAPSKPVSYPPSCQLTPPTPPSTNIVDSQLPKKDLTSENIQETQIVGRKRRQKLASFPSKFTRMDDEEDDVPEYGNSVEDSVCDYSPVRKTRRKSLRIRELSRLSCQTADKTEESPTKEFQIQQNPSEGNSPNGFEHYKQKDANSPSPVSSNNTERDELSFSINLGSTSAPLAAVKSQEKEEKYQTKAENDNARESAGSTAPLDPMTITLKSDPAVPSFKMPVPRQSNTPEEVRRTSPHLARGDQSIGTYLRTTKPNAGRSAGFAPEGSTDRLQGHEFHRISADVTRHFQSRLHDRQQSPYPTPTKQNAAYPNSLQHGRKPIVGPSTPHLHHLHHLQMPQDDETHVCVECSKVFKRSIYLQRHMAREHWTTAKLFKCDTCSYETKHQSNLLVHKRTHTGERPYFCGDCGQRYTQGHLLKAHIRSRHSSNMQLYNMEKRSPNEVLASQTQAASSAEGQNNCNKKVPTVRPRDAVANRSGNEGLEKIQFLVDAASSFQNHKHFQHRNHSDKNLHGSLAKAFLLNEQATIDNKAQETKEDLNYGNLKHHYNRYHHRSGFAKEQLAMQQKKGESRTSGRMTTHSNGEVIDLDTPEPPAEVEGPGDKSNAIQIAPVLNGSSSPGVCPSVDFKSNRRKFEETPTPHSFLYSNGVNYPLEFFQPPTPSLNSSILFNTFLTSCLPNSYPLENRKSTLNQNSSQLRPPLNVSSSEGEDQYVDVDGDEEEDVKPLNLSTQKTVSSDNFARGSESEHQKTLFKQIPLKAYNQTFDPSNRFSAFASFHGLHRDEGVGSVIKSLNLKPIPSLPMPRADSVLGRDPIRERNPTESLAKCCASADVVDDSNYGSNEETSLAISREWSKEKASILVGSESVTSRSLEVEHPANGFGSSSPCPRDRCPDRLKLESLRRDVYRMLRVFMPYFVLDDVEGKTDALDNFLHEVLYSKLEG